MPSRSHFNGFGRQHEPKEPSKWRGSWNNLSSALEGSLGPKHLQDRVSWAPRASKADDDYDDDDDFGK
eukprot:8839375-Karenia_brevis.AAC.1